MPRKKIVSLDSQQFWIAVRKTDAATKRVEVAYKHVVDAKNLLDKALCDLSSVVGANQLYRKIREASDLAHNCYAELANYQSEPVKTWKLDHEPSDKELKSGHGPGFGCGGK